MKEKTNTFSEIKTKIQNAQREYGLKYKFSKGHGRRAEK